MTFYFLLNYGKYSLKLFGIASVFFSFFFAITLLNLFCCEMLCSSLYGTINCKVLYDWLMLLGRKMSNSLESVEFDFILSEKQTFEVGGPPVFDKP